MSEKPINRFRRIEALEPEQRDALHAMFFDGRSVKFIIDKFQQGFGLWKDDQYNTLEKYLYRYKRDVIDKKAVVVAAKVDPEKKVEYLRKASEDLDVLEEMAALVLRQKSRVDKLYKVEVGMPSLFGTLGGEMRTLMQFLNDFQEKQFDLGLAQRVPKKTKVVHNVC